MNEVADVDVVAVAPDLAELRASFLGESLYFRLPESHFVPEAIGDALLLSVLAPAMRAGLAVRIPPEYAVSERLMANVDAIQDIWQDWNRSLKKIVVEASSYRPEPASGGVALFYAGGVDSTYSLAVHQNEITTLVSAVGFDFNLPKHLVEQVTEKNSRFAKGVGKDFIQFETNFSRFVFNLGISRTFVYGAALASMGILTGQRRCMVASSQSPAYLQPGGAHPVLDPLFSNGSTGFEHDTLVSRLKKTLAISKNDVLMDNLHVCWDQAVENCGRCSKCVRTMMALKLAGVAGPFPCAVDTTLLKQMASVTDYEYVVELVVAAHEAGDLEAVKAMKKGLRRHDFREAVGYIDKAFFGGRIKQFRRSRNSEPDDLILVDLRPDLKV